MFAALAQPTRLEAFRTIVRHEPSGLAAGEVARLAGVPQNTMSAHLGLLSRAGLVTASRSGRSIVYRANLDAVRHLVLHLLQDCCGGHADVCRPVLADLQPCC